MKLSSLLAGAAAASLMMAAAYGASAQSWTDSITVGGRMYLDFSNNSFEVNGAKSSAKNGYGFDVKRVYLQVDKKFNDTYSLQVQTDVSPVPQSVASTTTCTQAAPVAPATIGVITCTTANSNTLAGQGLYLKKAFFKASFSPMLEVSIGSNELPWIPYAESIYGNRYLENTVLEQNNDGGRGTFGTSADWGVHVAGKLNDVFSYQVSMINGKGYRDSSRSKTVDFEGRLSAKLDQWNFAVGGYTGKRGASVYNGTTLVATPHDATRLNALAAFVGDRGKLGVEYFTATDWATSAITDLTVNHAKGDKAEGESVFGSYRITPMFTLFGRYDDVKPSKKLSPFNKDAYYNFGIQTVPMKGITLSLVAKHNKLDAYAGGAVKGALTRTEFSEIGIFTELRY